MGCVVLGGYLQKEIETSESLPRGSILEIKWISEKSLPYRVSINLSFKNT